MKRPRTVCLSDRLRVGGTEIVGDEECETVFQSSWHVVGDPEALVSFLEGTETVLGGQHDRVEATWGLPSNFGAAAEQLYELGLFTSS